MSEHTTHAYDCRPRCKSGQIEAAGLMYGESEDCYGQHFVEPYGDGWWGEEEI